MHPPTAHTLLSSADVSLAVSLSLGACSSKKLYCSRKGDPFQGSCLTHRNELSKETQARDFTGRGARAESGGSGDPGEPFCRVGHSLRLCGDEVGFRVAWPLRVLLLARASFSQDGLQHEGFWEVGRTA